MLILEIEGGLAVLLLLCVLLMRPRSPAPIANPTAPVTNASNPQLDEITAIMRAHLETATAHLQAATSPAATPPTGNQTLDEVLDVLRTLVAAIAESSSKNSSAEVVSALRAFAEKTPIAAPVSDNSQLAEVVATLRALTDKITASSPAAIGGASQQFDEMVLRLSQCASLLRTVARQNPNSLGPFEVKSSPPIGG